MDPRAKCLDAVSRPHRVRLSPISRCCGRVVRIEASIRTTRPQHREIGESRTR